MEEAEGDQIPILESENDVDSNEYERRHEIFIKVYTRNFVNERNANMVDSYQIGCDAIEDFFSGLWSCVSPLIKQEILYVDESNEYIFNEKDAEIGDLHKFVLLQDKSSKKCMNILDVTNKKLQKWSSHNPNQEENNYITCFVQVYGNKLQTKAQYSSAHKQLLVPHDKDRAGAATNSATSELAKQLKEKHKNVLTGLHISWLQYANYVLAAESHKQQELIDEIPPDVVKYFKLADDNPVNQMNTVRRSVAIGQRVNRGIEQTVNELSDDIDALINNMEQGLSFAKVIKGRISGLKAQCGTTDFLLEGFDEAIGPRMDQFGRNLQSKIVDMDDIDHQMEPNEDENQTQND